MIISHKYRYIFIEIPMTGSYAIRSELCSHYDGSPILHKHANYQEFRRIATDDEKRYFVFATMRNPLDTIVSGYFKLKTDHKGAFSNLEAVKQKKADYSDHKAYKFIKSTNATFESFFRRYYNQPYSSMIELSSNDLDFVIRYERFQEDFAEVLRLLSIEQVGPVPLLNKTGGRRRNWELYYTPDIIEQAKRVTGPLMRKWGYAFPASWGAYEISWRDQVMFRLVNMRKRVYLNHIRYSDRAYARMLRRLRAVL